MIVTGAAFDSDRFIVERGRMVTWTFPNSTKKPFPGLKSEPLPDSLLRVDSFAIPKILIQSICIFDKCEV